MKQLHCLSSILGLHLLQMLMLTPSASWGCHFPGFLQSQGEGVKRKWFTHMMHNNGHRDVQYDTQVTFKGRIMEVKILGIDENTFNPPKEYTRRCVLEIEPGEYLVTHNEAGGSVQQYMCIQFFNRSRYITQIMGSHLSHIQDPHLCSDRRMKMIKWPLVNTAELDTAYERCPFTGGYNIRIYDRSEQRGYCDSYDGHTRLESECMKGEGMYFRLRDRDCVPKGLHMHTDQRVFCLGTWQQGEVSFTIIRHDKDQRFWCLRSPKRIRNEFSAVLFKDLYCDEERLPDNVEGYVALDILRDIPQSLANLCIDDYEQCKYWSTPCDDPSSDTYLTCAKRCQVCTDSRPTTCTLPNNLRGQWLETNRNGTDVVEIDDMYISARKNADFRCIQWEGKQSNLGTEFLEQMFVTTFDNGCRARYTCAQFKKHSPSVLQYKLSHSQAWPFKDITTQNIDCGSFKYSDDNSPFSDLYHSRHFKVLLSQEERVYVDCKLDHPMEFSVVTKDDSVCHGLLTETREGNRIQMVLYDCPTQQRQHQMGCLDSVHHGFLGNQIIVTEPTGWASSEEAQCWLFPVFPEHTVYLLPLIECNEGAVEKINIGLINPFATFSEIVPTTTTTTTTKPTTTTPVPSTTPEWGPTESGVMVDGVVAWVDGEHPSGHRTSDGVDWAIEEELYGEEPYDDNKRDTGDNLPSSEHTMSGDINNPMGPGYKVNDPELGDPMLEGSGQNVEASGVIGNDDRPNSGNQCHYSEVLFLVGLLAVLFLR